MLGLTDSILEQIIVHKVGNKSRDENIYVSPNTLDVDDGVKELLHKYFLSPFKSKAVHWIIYIPIGTIEPKSFVPFQ